MDKDKQQILILSSILVVIIAAFVFLFINYIYKDIQTMEKRKQELLGNIGREILMEEIQDLRVVLDSLYVYNEDQTNKLYPQSELNELGTFLKDIGYKNGLILKEVSPDYSTIKNFIELNQVFHTFPIEVEYQGSFSKITRFIDQLSEFEFYIKITEYSINITEFGQTDLRILIKGQMFIRQITVESQT